MGYLDLIRRMRTAEPDPVKASRAIRILGWVCILGGVWNYVLPQVAPFEESGFRLPNAFPVLALGLLAGVGWLLLMSARGIAECKPWGRTTARAGIVGLLLGSGVFFLGVMPDMLRLPGGAAGLPVVFRVFTAIAFVQLAVPAWFGLRYLGRLPVEGDGSGVDTHAGRFGANRPPAMVDAAGNPASRSPYTNSPSPLGFAGTFLLLIAIPVLGMLALDTMTGPRYAGLVFPVVFALLFAGPTVFNYRPSPFEAGRTVLERHTGGGSMYLFHGSWPFFRLIVYTDALEVRVMFHRYLIPFDKMGELPAKVGFFTTGLLIQSDLPGVPSDIRFAGLGMKKILASVRAARDARLGRGDRAAIADANGGRM